MSAPLSCLIPSEIIGIDGGHNFIILPSVVFAHFLKFLCFSHLGNRREKYDALRDLLGTIKEAYFIIGSEYYMTNTFLCLEIARKMMI